jgi:hypothetical protein
MFLKDKIGHSWTRGEMIFSTMMTVNYSISSKLVFFKTNFSCEFLFLISFLQ